MIFWKRKRSGKNTLEQEEYKAQMLKWLVNTPYEQQSRTMAIVKILTEAVTGTNKYNSFIKLANIVDEHIRTFYHNDLHEFAKWIKEDS